jgi:multimeric flavodoxin WrbA
MKILGIVGSQRKKGNTALLVQEALNAIDGEGVKTELLFLRDYQFSGCTGCLACHETNRCVLQDEMQDIYPKLDAADAIILGSPTYFYNVTSLVKAFIDRLYCYHVYDPDDRSIWSSVNEALGGKYAAVMAICEQQDERDMGFTAEAMSLPLTGLGYRVVDTIKVFKAFKKGDVLLDELALTEARNAGTRLVKMVQLREKTRKQMRS